MRLIHGRLRYFYNLEKTHQRKKHVTSSKINDDTKLTVPKEILEEEERFLKQIYTSRYTNPNGSEFIKLFNAENVLSEDTAKTWEGVMSVDECERALMTMESNKTPGTDGLTCSIAFFGTL